MNSPTTIVKLFYTILFLLSATVGQSQSLSLEEILKLVDGTPSEITSLLTTKDWKFISADKEMSDDGTLLMESTMIFYFPDKYGNYIASFGHVKTFNFDASWAYDPRKKIQTTRIGYYLKIGYKFTDTKIYNSLNKQLLDKGLKVQQDEVLEDGRIAKSFKHDEFKIAFAITPSVSGQTYQFVVESKYLVDE